MGFRENLKEEMVYQDIRTQELADRSGVKKKTIDHYLTANPQEPSVTNAVKIAQALGVSVEYLVLGNKVVSSQPQTKEQSEFLALFAALSAEKRHALVHLARLLADPPPPSFR